MNARHLFLSTLSIGAIAIAAALTAGPSQANPSSYNTRPFNVATSHYYGNPIPARVTFHNNSPCTIQVVLVDTHEVRYLAPGQTVNFRGLTSGATPVFHVHNSSNGAFLRTLSLQPISTSAYVGFKL